MQLACNVQIPKRFGGAWEGEAIYIGRLGGEFDSWKCMDAHARARKEEQLSPSLTPDLFSPPLLLHVAVIFLLFRHGGLFHA